MNIQIITSSYPAYKGDPGGTAGLFVESFALELASQGHQVIIQPVKRKSTYESPHENIIIEPIPWEGGDQVLAAMNFFNLKNWFVFLNFFKKGKQNTTAIHQKYKIDRTMCMWIIPCGVFGYHIHSALKKDYDVWALGSDIWKIRKIPIIGNMWIKRIVHNARNVYADGVQLCRDVKEITQTDCHFLASTRSLPQPEPSLVPLVPENVKHLLFVGRYHKNKGPDILLKAVKQLPEAVQSQIRVHMFGLGDMEMELKNLCLELNLAQCVNLYGPINAQELANILTQVDYLLIPSRIESIPVIFSDALQTGTPVISTPVGDLADFMNQYQCGILAQDATPEAYAQAIEQAIKKNKEDFTEKVSCAYNTFKIDQSVKQWLKEEKP